MREDAIVAAVNRLLAEKGFEAMTVDEVAADVGIAKASLYKHFASKEELAAAAMVRVLDHALAFIDQEAAREDVRPIDHLKAVARWTMQLQLAGEMPSLPAQNSTLRTALMQHRTYLDRVMQVSERLGAWITAAQAAGEIDPRLPPEAHARLLVRLENVAAARHLNGVPKPHAYRQAGNLYLPVLCSKRQNF